MRVRRRRRIQTAADNLPVPVQQQLAAADRGVRRPALPVVLAGLRRALLAAQAPQAVPLAVQLHVLCKFVDNLG